MDNLNYLTIKKLLQIHAFKLQEHNPLRWSNGWEAPIYFDDRRILSYTHIRNFVKLELGRIVAEMYPDADVIAGIATNAIAHSVLVADQLALPYVYVYPTPKDHGLENQIEGDLRPNQKVVIMENQVSLGLNAERVIDVLRDNGCTVMGIVTIFDYQFDTAQHRLAELDVPLISLTSYEALTEVALNENFFPTADIKMLQRWHSNPGKWKKQK